MTACSVALSPLLLSLLLLIYRRDIPGSCFPVSSIGPAKSAPPAANLGPGLDYRLQSAQDFLTASLRREGVESSLSSIQPQPSWRVIIGNCSSLEATSLPRYRPATSSVPSSNPSPPPCHARKRGGDTRGPHYHTTHQICCRGQARLDIHPSSHTGQHNVHSHCCAIQTTVTVTVACLLCTLHSPSRRGTWRQAFG